MSLGSDCAPPVVPRVQLTNSQNAQAGISDLLKNATQDLTSSVDVLHQLFFNLKQAWIAMLTVLNEVRTTIMLHKPRH
eukprot:43824-Eustigmatos_ZCMA.PRE.1